MREKKYWFIQLKKYDVKFHKIESLVFIIFTIIFTFILNMGLGYYSISMSYNEYMQFSNQYAFHMNIMGEFGETQEEIQEEVQLFLSSFRSKVNAIGFYPREMDENKISLGNALLYCPSKGYQFDYNNMKTDTVFSLAGYELIKVAGSKQIGDTVDGIVQGEKVTFHIINEIKNRYLIDSYTGSLSKLNDGTNDVYLVNPIYVWQYILVSGILLF